MPPVKLPVELENYLVGVLERTMSDSFIFAERLNKFTAGMTQNGATTEAIQQVLLSDQVNNGRIFGELKSALKESLVEGTNQAGRMGQVLEYPKDKEYYTWITVGGHKICPDCDARAGEVKTWEEWVGDGLPGSGFSVCRGNCYCVLDPVGNLGRKLEPPPPVKKPKTKPKTPKKLSAEERLENLITTQKQLGTNSYFTKFHVGRYGNVSFKGMSRKNLNAVADALEDTIGRYNITVQHLGFFQGRLRSGTRGAGGAAWGRETGPGSRYIGIQKTYAGRHAAQSKETQAKWARSRLSDIYNTERSLERAKQNLADTKYQDQANRYKKQIVEYEIKLKRLKDKRYNKWSTSSAADDSLYATTKHEAYHQVDYQLRADGVPLCGQKYGDGGFFGKHLRDLGVTRNDWYFVSEYAGSSYIELWAETGTALDLGMYVPAKIKKAFIATLKDAGVSWP